jgi:hypothetical protein
VHEGIFGGSMTSRLATTDTSAIHSVGFKNKQAPPLEPQKPILFVTLLYLDTLSKESN